MDIQQKKNSENGKKMSETIIHFTHKPKSYNFILDETVPLSYISVSHSPIYIRHTENLMENLHFEILFFFMYTSLFAFYKYIQHVHFYHPHISL